MSQQSILLIDECRELLDAFTEVLSVDGFRVLPANSGDEAVALFAAHQSEIALVVGGIDLPLDSGCRMAGKIRHINKVTPILFVTSFSPHEASKMIGECNDYYLLQKPFHPETLSRCIGAIISG